eukprot:4688259-Alexandrium_andersonii.AAC.1
MAGADPWCWNSEVVGALAGSSGLAVSAGRRGFLLLWVWSIFFMRSCLCAVVGACAARRLTTYQGARCN